LAAFVTIFSGSSQPSERHMDERLLAALGRPRLQAGPQALEPAAPMRIEARLAKGQAMTRVVRLVGQKQDAYQVNLVQALGCDL
jgi:hypothetical protein